MPSFSGLGILSRKQIIHLETIYLKKNSAADSNQRIAVNAKLRLGANEEEEAVDVIIVHFSYDPHQQCQNADDVITVIKGRTTYVKFKPK